MFHLFVKIYKRYQHDLFFFVVLTLMLATHINEGILKIDVKKIELSV